MTCFTEKVIKKADHQVSCDLDGEIAILNLKTSLYFGLNQVGAAVWDVLKEPKPAEEICAHVRKLYEVDEARCCLDIFDLLKQL